MRLLLGENGRLFGDTHLPQGEPGRDVTLGLVDDGQEPVLQVDVLIEMGATFLLVVQGRPCLLKGDEQVVLTQ
jgi:hypothetical protein